MRSHRTPLQGEGKCSLGFPTELPEYDSDSRAPQMPLGATEKPALESPCHKEVRDSGFSLFSTADASGYHRRVENKVGGPLAGSSPGPKEKSGEGGLRLVPAGLGLAVAVAGDAGRPLQKSRCVALQRKTCSISPAWPILMKRDSSWFYGVYCGKAERGRE